MKSYKQFLTEVKRSPERAKKLVDYIQKKWPNHYGDIKTRKDWREKDWENYGWTTDDQPKGKPAVRNPRELKTFQKTVTPSHVKHLIDNPEAMNKPIKVVKMDGQEFIRDGNHRAFAKRLLGHDKINTEVRTTKLSTGQKKRKKMTGTIDREAE